MAKPRQGPHELLDPPVSAANSFNLLLELRFEYMGPAGEVSAPTVRVINAGEEVFNAIENVQMAVNNASDIEAVLTTATVSNNKGTFRADA